MRAASPLTFVMALALMAACPAVTAAADGGAKSMASELVPALVEVRKGRVLFSHHSVGEDLLAGIRTLDAEGGGPALRIERLESGAAPGDGAALFHASGGRNTDPRSKIAFFRELVDRAAPARPQLALMKLCFVDFGPRTDVDALFAEYRETIEALRRRHPGIRFAHVTVPLFARPTGPKWALYRLLGREVWEDEANARRSAYNKLLAQAFPSDPVFDLASAESAGPDGVPSTFELRGATYPSLHPAFTTDGGHLNAAGQRAVGAAALRFLAGALQGGAVR